VRSANARSGPFAGNEDLRFCTCACALLAVVAVLKGVRQPNLWAYTQSLLTYQNHAFRRGLLGSFLTLLHWQSYLAFSAVSAWILVFLLLATALLAVQTGLFRSAPILCAAFAISFAVTYNVNMIGYLDNAALLLTAVTLLLRERPRLYLPASVLCAVACLLLHENTIFFALPLLFLPPVLRIIRRPPGISVRLATANILAIAMVACATLGWLLLSAHMSVAQAHDLAIRTQRSVPYPLFSNFFIIQTASLPMMLRFMAHYYFFKLPYWENMAQGAIAFFPAAGLFCYFSWRLLPPRAGARILCIAASLAPLLMHFFGFDLYRWDSLAVWTSFLALLAIAGGQPLRVAGMARNVVMLVIVLNAAAGPGLLGEDSIHGFLELRQIAVAGRLLTAQPQHSAYPTRPAPEPYLSLKLTY
jgi:hypothetical protein